MLLIVLPLGCDAAKTSGGRETQTSHLRLLISLHNYATSELGRAPKNQEEFQEFIQQKCQQTLEQSEIASVEDLFVSERSGQPLVVIYGPRPKSVSPDVVAYEQEPTDGMRQVGFSLGRIQKVNQTQFLELVPVAAK